VLVEARLQEFTRGLEEAVIVLVLGRKMLVKATILLTEAKKLL
jgi:hypothetical protein